MQTKELSSFPQQKEYPPQLPFQIRPKFFPESGWDQLITIPEVRLERSTLYAIESMTLKYASDDKSLLTSTEQQIKQYLLKSFVDQKLVA